MSCRAARSCPARTRARARSPRCRACRASPPAASSARSRSLACSTPTMFSGLSAPERQAGIGRGQHLAHDLLGRIVGVDGAHLGAVDHHVGRPSSSRRSSRPPSMSRSLLDAALLVQQVDLAAHLLVRRQDRLGLADARCRTGAASSARARSIAIGDRAEQRAPTRRSAARRAARRGRASLIATVFGSTSAKTMTRTRHDDGGVDHAASPNRAEQHAGGERRGADVDDVVADQHRADQPLARVEQPVDDARRARRRCFSSAACGRARRP